MFSLDGVCPCLLTTKSIVPGSVYFYAPNKGAAIFFAIAFAFSGFYHIYQCMYEQDSTILVITYQY